MKILVTGGAGYIGSVTVEYLLNEGHEVAVVDDLSTGHLSSVHPSAKFYEGNVGSQRFTDHVFRSFKVDGLIHFASKSLVSESIKYPQAYIVGNVKDGLSLFESSIRNNVHRIVLSSTANVYGAPTRIPIKETDEISPGSPYGESKYLLERALRALGRRGLLNYGILRYFNAAGASENFGELHDPETHLIPLVLQTALGQRESITIYGTDYDTPDGTCIRDYVHVVDLARAHLLALLQASQQSFTFNVGTGAGTSVLEVIQAAENVTGKPIRTNFGNRRPGDPPELVADCTEIRKRLDWQPQYGDITSIVKSTWSWLTRDNVRTREKLA